MLPGLRDTSWPARLALFAALVGHAFAPRPLEGPPRTLAATRPRPDRAFPTPVLPTPALVGRPAKLAPTRVAPAARTPSLLVPEAAAEPSPGRTEVERRALRLSGLSGEAGTAPYVRPFRGTDQERADPERRSPLPALSWRLEGRTFLGLQLGRVRVEREDRLRREEIPRGFGVRAVLSF